LSTTERTFSIHLAVVLYFGILFTKMNLCTIERIKTWVSYIARLARAATLMAPDLLAYFKPAVASGTTDFLVMRTIQSDFQKSR
jgi:hypothetical protein